MDAHVSSAPIPNLLGSGTDLPQRPAPRKLLIVFEHEPAVCPSSMASACSAARKRRQRRYHAAFLAGAMCVRGGAPGLEGNRKQEEQSTVSQPLPKSTGVQTIQQERDEVGAGDLACGKVAVVDAAAHNYEADHPRGRPSDSGGLVSQALASPLPVGSSRKRGQADTRQPLQADHPRVAMLASGDSSAIDTDSSLVAWGAISGPGASASDALEQLLPHALKLRCSMGCHFRAWSLGFRSSGTAAASCCL